MNDLFLTLDIETTGMQPAKGRTIEIGSRLIMHRQITSQSFHYYLEPDVPVEAGAFAVHGISDAFLKGKPKFSMIAEELIAWVQDKIVVIHNAPFDLSFLDAELAALGMHPLRHYAREVIDSLVLARQKHRGKKNNLDALIERYKIPPVDRSKHGALLDAELLAWVFLAMTRKQESIHFEELFEEVSNINLAEYDEKQPLIDARWVHDAIPSTNYFSDDTLG